MDGGNREDFAHDSWGGKLEDSRRVVDSALDKGPAPLDSMARGFVRAGESKMVACLIDLALAEGGDRTKELLRKENKHKETALHEAVRVGNKDIVDLLMGKDRRTQNWQAFLKAAELFFSHKIVFFFPQYFNISISISQISA